MEAAAITLSVDMLTGVAEFSLSDTLSATDGTHLLTVSWMLLPTVKLRSMARACSNILPVLSPMTVHTFITQLI